MIPAPVFPTLGTNATPSRQYEREREGRGVVVVGVEVVD